MSSQCGRGRSRSSPARLFARRRAGWRRRRERWPAARGSCPYRTRSPDASWTPSAVFRNDAAFNSAGGGRGRGVNRADGPGVTIHVLGEPVMRRSSTSCPWSQIGARHRRWKIAFIVLRSSKMVEPQPPPGSCHERGQGPVQHAGPPSHRGGAEPSRHPGDDPFDDLSERLHRTHPPVHERHRSRKASQIVLYGLLGSPRTYEYDHLISLELGRRDAVATSGPTRRVTESQRQGRELPPRARMRRPMTLAQAQRIVRSTGFVYNQNINPKPTPKPPPPPPPSPSPPDEGIVHPGAFCSPEGGTRTHQCRNTHGARACLDGRDRWQHA